jgi:hypothetical protein
MTDGAASGSAHDGKTVRCYAMDDDGNRCDSLVSFEEHGRYVSSLSGTDSHGTPLRDRFESGALRFQCPECGEVHYRCPVCTDPDDRSPPGWFVGDSSGEQLACHNCNDRAATRQRRGRY